jgi:hypothetical protein
VQANLICVSRDRNVSDLLLPSLPASPWGWHPIRQRAGVIGLYSWVVCKRVSRRTPEKHHLCSSAPLCRPASRSRPEGQSSRALRVYCVHVVTPSFISATAAAFRHPGFGPWLGSLSRETAVRSSALTRSQGGPRKSAGSAGQDEVMVEIKYAPANPPDVRIRRPDRGRLIFAKCLRQR